MTGFLDGDPLRAMLATLEFSFLVLSLSFSKLQPVSKAIPELNLFHKPTVLDFEDLSSSEEQGGMGGEDGRVDLFGELLNYNWE